MNIRKVCRYTWAGLLLTLPLFSYPLAWSPFFGVSAAFWDELHPVGAGVIAAVALAAALAEPQRLFDAWRRPLTRWVLISGMLCVGAAVAQLFLVHESSAMWWYGMFFIMLPWAGIALAPELKRLLPVWCAALFLLLLWSTIRTPLCTGFVGNWNWNFSLLAVTLPALVIVLLRSRHRIAVAAFAVSAGVAGVFIAFPELAPRGTLAGVIGAAALLGVILLFRRSERWRYALLAVLAGGALFISSINTPDAAHLSNARVQLWRGSLDLALVHSLGGLGPGRFESRIPPYLPHEYFLSDFPAVRHPHPHNEFLNLWAGFGFCGVFYFVMIVVGAVRNVRRRDLAGLWLVWSFLLLLIHGQFDILLATPLVGTLFWLIAGTLCGGGLGGAAPVVPRKVWPLLLAAALLVGAGVETFRRAQAGSALRAGRILLASGRPDAALAQLRRSIAARPTPNALYIAGMIEFYDFRRPEPAIELWRRIQEKMRLPSYLHLNRQLGYALTVIGRPEEALRHFDLEEMDFPYSALGAGLRLEALRRTAAPPEKIREQERKFESLMRIRQLSPAEFGKLRRHPDLDDEPLVRK